MDKLTERTIEMKNEEIAKLQDELKKEKMYSKFLLDEVSEAKSFIKAISDIGKSTSKCHDDVENPMFLPLTKVLNAVLALELNGNEDTEHVLSLTRDYVLTLCEIANEEEDIFEGEIVTIPKIKQWELDKHIEKQRELLD